MTNATVIKLIHVARRELRLDDDTYRALLTSVIPGKSSCRDMSLPELQAVLEAMEEKGFKVKPRKKPRRLPSPSDTSLKIRAVWHTMAADGFIRDDSDAALDRFVQRQTSQINGGKGIASLEWLRGDVASGLLESLKQWHVRDIKKALGERGITLPVNPRSDREVRDYDAVCQVWSDTTRRYKK